MKNAKEIETVFMGGLIIYWKLPNPKADKLMWREH